MNSGQLTKICMADGFIRKYYIGTLSSDTLPTYVPLPCCFIANTKPSDHAGEHWVAVYVNQRQFATYFCSYDEPPEDEFKKWLDGHTAEWTDKSKVLQGNSSTTCGQYCVCFLHFMCRSVSLTVFLSLFSCDRDENDEIVTLFVNGIYDQSTVVADKRFIE